MIGGKVVEDTENNLEFSREEDVEVRFPKIDEAIIEKIRDSRENLDDLTLDEIISFYSEVGELWEDESYRLREKAEEIARLSTGYSASMIEQSFDNFVDFLREDPLRRTVKGEIGDEEYLDEWVKRGDVRVHLQPRGRILHVLAGNAPPVGPVSMIKSSLAKNSNVVKFPSGDPATPIFLALSFRDVDETHPITKSTSVLYYDKNSEIEDKMISLSDGISVWGGQRAILSVREKADHATEIIEFGPRRGMQFVGKEVFLNDERLEEVAKNAARDLAIYDQNACFSPQVAWVEENADEFCEKLTKEMDKVSEVIPKGYASEKAKAGISQEKSISDFMGDEVYDPDSTEWTIIKTDDVERTKNHPLGRTLYVIEVENLNEALEYVDESVQTVGVS
ncbi:hypothetical protein AKJ52_02320, partial [candidate division MSBL1 archaeon SCGC-AAA382C18]